MDSNWRRSTFTTAVCHICSHTAALDEAIPHIYAQVITDASQAGARKTNKIQDVVVCSCSDCAFYLYKRKGGSKRAPHLPGDSSRLLWIPTYFGRPKPVVFHGGAPFYLRRVPAWWQYGDLYPLSSLSRTGVRFSRPPLNCNNPLVNPLFPQKFHQRWCNNLNGIIPKKAQSFHTFCGKLL